MQTLLESLFWGYLEVCLASHNKSSLLLGWVFHGEFTAMVVSCDRVHKETILKRIHSSHGGTERRFACRIKTYISDMKTERYWCCPRLKDERFGSRKHETTVSCFFFLNKSVYEEKKERERERVMGQAMIWVVQIIYVCTGENSVNTQDLDLTKWWILIDQLPDLPLRHSVFLHEPSPTTIMTTKNHHTM